MGGLASRVGTSIAAKHAANIGNSWVLQPVNSTTRMIPVNGARTTAVKKAAMPVTAYEIGSPAMFGNQCRA